MDINTQVLETKYVINLGQFLRIVPDIKWYIFKLIKFVQPVQLKPIKPEQVCVVVATDHQMVVIQVRVGKHFIDDVLIDGGSRVNIITKHLKVQLVLSKPNPTPYNLCMANQTIANAFGLIRDLKIFIYGIPYTVTSVIININVLDSSYSMLLRCPWLRDSKVSHDWGTNITIIQGTCIIRTIFVIKKHGVQTKRLKVLMCYDFHFGIS